MEDKNKNKWQERAEKLDKAGKSMSKLGGKLTLMFTVPILLTLFFGVPGLIIGIVIALAVLGS